MIRAQLKKCKQMRVRLWRHIIQIKIFHYTRCNTPKCVTSLLGSSTGHCAQATLLCFSKKSCSGWLAAGNPVSNLTSPKFESQTFRTEDERVTARPTGYVIMYSEIKITQIQVTKQSTLLIYFMQRRTTLRRTYQTVPPNATSVTSDVETASSVVGGYSSPGSFQVS